MNTKESITLKGNGWTSLMAHWLCDVHADAAFSRWGTPYMDSTVLCLEFIQSALSVLPLSVPLFTS